MVPFWLKKQTKDRLCPHRSSVSSDCSYVAGLSVDQVLRVGLVPDVDQLFARLANVLRIVDLAGEHAGLVQPVVKDSIGAVLDAELAIQGDGGSPDAETLHFDGTTAPAVLEDLVAQLFHRQLHGAFYQAGRSRETADELGLLDGVALVDARAECIDGFNSVCHFRSTFLGF
jgi:hypothetical protein